MSEIDAVVSPKAYFFRMVLLRSDFLTILVIKFTIIFDFHLRNFDFKSKFFEVGIFKSKFFEISSRKISTLSRKKRPGVEHNCDNTSEFPGVT